MNKYIKIILLFYCIYSSPVVNSTGENSSIYNKYKNLSKDQKIIITLGSISTIIIGILSYKYYKLCSVRSVSVLGSVIKDIRDLRQINDKFKENLNKDTFYSNEELSTLNPQTVTNFEEFELKLKEICALLNI